MNSSFNEDIRRYPFVRLLFPLIFGVVFAINTQLNIPYFSILLIAIFIVLATLILFKKTKKYHRRWIFGFLVSIFLFITGIEIVNIKFSENNSTAFLDKGFIVASVTESPSEKEKIIKTVLEVEAIKSNDDWISSEGNVIVYFEKDSLAKTLKIGDQILFEPQFDEIENAGNPNEFDYKKYLAFHMITQQTYLKSGNWSLFNKDGKKGIKYYADKAREYLLSLYRKSEIKDDEYAVLSALTLGYKTKLDEEIKKAYSSSGAMHVLAVSGLHVGIIYIVLSSILGFLRKRKSGRIINTVLIILFLWGYAFITGLSPSVMRAATMFTFVVVGKALNRNSSIYNTLAASAFLLIIINPYIITEIGFQLSYLAVIGIVFFQPKIYKLFYFKNYILDKIWALMSVSIAAQIATTPISLLYFHQFPNYFLLTNIIVVPLATFIVYGAMILLAFSFVPILNVWIGKALSLLVIGLNESVMFIEKLPYSISFDIQVEKLQVILLYLLIILVGVFVVYKKQVYLRYSLVSLISILMISILNSISISNQKRVIVYNMKNSSAYNFIDGDDNILFSDYSANMDYSKMLYSVKNNWLTLGVNNEKIVDLNTLGNQYLFSNLLTIDNRHIFFKKNFVKFYDTQIYFLKNSQDIIQNTNDKFDIDYIFVSNNCKISIEQLKKRFNFEKIIIDSSNSFYTRNYWKEECEKNEVICHIVNEQGAFEIKI